MIKMWLKVGFKRIFRAFIPVLAFLGLLIEMGTIFFANDKNNTFDYGLPGYLALFVGSFIIAALFYFPKKSYSAKLSSNDTTIEIKVGDLFKENSDLVIGTNDYFDTELGEVIKPSSIQGQFLQKIYGNDQSRLDGDIDNLLKPYKKDLVINKEKKRGKNLCFPHGTTITLNQNAKRYYLVAYGKMGNDLKCKCTSTDLWDAFNLMWEEIRLKGQRNPVSIPVVGSDLARTGLTKNMLIKLIIMSFVVANRAQTVTKKLTIVIWGGDYEDINMYEVQEFLDSIKNEN